jgi:putative restriction endonuclease
MPFHALGGDRDQVWETFTTDGAPSRAKATTRLCRFDHALWDCLQDPGFRRRARLILVSLYFTPAEQIELCTRLELPFPRTPEIKAIKAEGEAFKTRQKKGRDGRFKSLVLNGYHFTCALTGYRLDTESGSIVQAAHIHQHAKSGNDDPGNGLALTPDAHWMFDSGLWTAVPIGDDFVIKVANGHFTESPGIIRLMPLNGRALHFAALARIRPDPAHFHWHISAKFLG